MKNTPEPTELAYQVFATDPRVVEYTKKAYETRDNEVRLRRAIIEVWRLLNETVGRDDVIADSYREAVTSKDVAQAYHVSLILGERVATRWTETPMSVLVTALQHTERLIPVPLPRTLIKVGETETMITQPFVDFIPRRLVLGGAGTCDGLLVHSIRAANVEAICADQGVYGGCFASDVFPFTIGLLPECGPANTIRLVVENIGDIDVWVTPVILGPDPNTERERATQLLFGVK